jgi:transcription-repair coupling factor (superfamily II helicase)
VSTVKQTGSLLIDPDLLPPDAQVEALLKELARGKASAGNLWGASQALILARLMRRTKAGWCVVASTEAEAAGVHEDLAAFGVEALLLPARGESDAEGVRKRLQAAQQLSAPLERRHRVVVASLLSVLEPLPAPDEVETKWLHLQTGVQLDLEALLTKLVDAGFTRTPLAEKPGEASWRGEILDVFPFASELPLRIEIFDGIVESLRTFDPLDQRSVDRMSQASVCLASDVGGVEDGEGAQLVELLAAERTRELIWAQVEPMRISDRAEGLRIRSPSHQRALMWTEQALEGKKRLEVQSLPAQINFDTRSVQSLAVGIKDAPAALLEAQKDGTRVLVACRSEAEWTRFRGILDEQGASSIETCLGGISKGFRLPQAKLLIINHRELVGVLGKRGGTKSAPAHRVRALQSFFELKLGDIVVHAVHGVARFAGLKRMARGGGEEEHLHLLFADEVSLFVPAARIEMVQRYVGTGSAAPTLDKIGGGSFRKRKEKVEKALYDLAVELLEVQARRAMKQRAPWGGDQELYDQMVAAFPWTDTVDQASVAIEIAHDLNSERAMDRLLCGDVGFGKTELAIRAAFRVVVGGAQVAVLVPTTVLAQQHYETFRERLADFPVTVAVLSRYVSTAETKATLEKVARGEVDILIGTHRILSKDIGFKRLGLVVVDEEQRFGVTHKEHFKKLRAEVDLLTLSATPIPRTLHMSISGLRDISALTIPPEGRQEIETNLAERENEALIREALLRERARGGQVLFLHNRVSSIHAMAIKLSQLVPECSYAVGHGQMGARELEKVMRVFIEGEVDVLVATTIIESGVDIPAAGTIIIDHADEFGLAELHQLRGRVGRGRQKSWCYLLVEGTKPIREVAKERLKALEELTQLGAGFAISMKDLEIRGAGNILGPQQSGHIAAIGYDMYCRLLKQTVERLQAGGEIEAEELVAEQESQGCELELGLRSFLPDAWIPDPKVRLDILRQLSTVRSHDDAQQALAMLADRFGRVPEEAKALVHSFELAARLETIGVRRLLRRQDVYVLEYRDRVLLEQGLNLRGVEFRHVKTGLAHLAVPERVSAPVKSLAWFESLLRDAPREAKIART